MQLQMTAPLDIGMEQIDPTLGTGQDDMFDLGHAESGLRRAGGLAKLGHHGEDMSDDESSQGAPSDDDDEALDSDEEREKKTRELEEQLDGLYDSYQERLRERDAKVRVKAARQKDTEWSGVSGVRDDDDSEASDGEGGWEEMEAAKALADQSSSDESEDEDEDMPAPETNGKRKRSKEEPLKRSAKQARVAPAPESKSSRLWFSQDIFGQIGGLDAIDDDSEQESDVSMEETQDDKARVLNIQGFNTFNTFLGRRK